MKAAPASNLRSNQSEAESGRISQALPTIHYMDDASQSSSSVSTEKKDAFEPELPEVAEETKLVAQQEEKVAYQRPQSLHLNAKDPDGSTNRAPEKKKRRKTPEEIRLIIMVAFLFVILVSTILTVYLVYKSTGFYVGLDNNRVVVELETRKLSIFNQRGELVLSGHVASGIPLYRLAMDCSGDSSSPVCLRWKNAASLTVDLLKNSAVHCYRFTWRQLSSDTVLSGCFDISAHWYGLGFLANQQWPLEEVSIDNARLLLDSQKGSIGHLLAYYWLTSSGVEISAFSEIPLNFSINAHNKVDNTTSNQFCLFADSKNLRSLYYDKPLISLAYNVCVADSMVEVEKDYAMTLKSAFELPISLPEERNFRAPIWSTFGKFSQNVSEAKVLTYAAEIVRHNYPHSLMMINEGWEREIGDLEFDPKRFPTPLNMTGTLISHGFSLSVEVTPLISTMSETLHDAMTGVYLVHDSSQQVPGLVRWRRSVRNMGTIGAIVDVTSEDARKWMQNKLEALMRKYSLFSLRFVAGETSYLPYLTSFGGDLIDPNHFATHYAKLANFMGPNNHISVGFESQAYGGLLCQQELSSTWEGLRQAIPSMLTASVLGYPLVVPDPVGGTHCAECRPEEELYIRWMQMMTFFPVMHFSVPPHDYGQDVVSLALQLMNRHAEMVFPRVQRYLNSSTRFEPLIQPLWWIAPRDAEAQKIDDEFLVGGDLLVAPVLGSGLRLRDIYIPEGSWSDVSRGGVVVGPRWISSYSVAITEVPYFEKVVDP